MKLGLMVGYSGAKLKLPMELVLKAEALGFDSAWTSEAWGSDAITTATWMLAKTTKIKLGTAIMQTPARTPSCSAMTAMSLDQLSGGRFILGFGPSGPQVAEGWYGQAYAPALGRMREYIKIVREILARENPLNFDGKYYQIPYQGEDSTGLGKPLKSILHGDPNIPIYTAAVTPGGVRLAAEVGDGVFPIWMNPARGDIFEKPISEGLAKGGRDPERFDVAPFVHAAMGDDIDACRMGIKHNMALYIGGMGARNKNFYNDYTSKLGYSDAAAQIQDLYLSGQKNEAAAAVPDALVDEVALVGPAGHIREQLQHWKTHAASARIGTMIIATQTPDVLNVIAEEML